MAAASFFAEVVRTTKSAKPMCTAGRMLAIWKLDAMRRSCCTARVALTQPYPANAMGLKLSLYWHS